MSLSTRRRLGPNVAWFAAVYGIRPWEIDLLTAAEVLDMQVMLPDVVRACGGMELIAGG